METKPNDALPQLRKYRIGEFGVCPLNECNGQPVLPIGLRDTLRYHEAMVYCPRCGLIFHPAQKQLNFRDDNLDGAFFGTTFAHLLLMQVRCIAGMSSCLNFALALLHLEMVCFVVVSHHYWFFFFFFHSISTVSCSEAQEEVKNPTLRSKSIWLQNPF